MTAPWSAGDTTPALAGTCMDGDDPVDLVTGVTAVNIHLRKPDGTTIDRAASSHQADGTWTMTWTDGDLVAGVYDCEVEVTYSAGGVQTFPAASFEVRRQIA